ncbi:MAG: hypothetical protein ACJAT4_001205 [Granulosicoccus sp.]|jgi:hypothetical protein
MNRKSISRQIQNFISENISTYDLTILEDQLIITRQIKGVKCSLNIRCQSFVVEYLMGSPVNLIKNNELEKQFELLLLDEMKKYYNDDFTFGESSASFGLTSPIADIRIKSENDVIEYCEKLQRHISEVEKEFFYPMTDKKKLSAYIAKFSYEKNLKVMVGSRFPVMTLKKMFLLHVGNQMERYNEYKEGLFKQIESFPIRKPKRAEEAKLFMKNFEYLVKMLGN